MKKLMWLVAGMLAVFVIYNLFFASRRLKCDFGRERFTVSSVNYGMFVEFTPQTGTVSQDTIAKITLVKVAIDRLYLPRIVAGLNATTTLNNIDYALKITDVHPIVTEGRFSVDMVFKGEMPSDLADGKQLRLRIEFGGAAEALLVPVGGFYKDTGGNWMYVVEGKKRAVKRHVKLGRKNTEHFEVLDGLKAGDSVITSSYENFGDHESIELSDIKRRARSVYM